MQTQLNIQSLEQDITKRVTSNSGPSIINYHTEGLAGFHISKRIQPILTSLVDPLRLRVIDMADLFDSDSPDEGIRESLLPIDFDVLYAYGFEHFGILRASKVFGVFEESLLAQSLITMGKARKFTAILSSQFPFGYSKLPVFKIARNLHVIPSINTNIDQISGGIDIVKEKVNERFGQDDVDWEKAAEFAVEIFEGQYDFSALKKLLAEKYREFLVRILEYREVSDHTFQCVLESMGVKANSSMLFPILSDPFLYNGFLRWNSNKRAYSPNKSVQRIYTNSFIKKALGITIDYGQVLNYYSNLIREIPSSRGIFILEYFYHSLNSGKTETDMIQEFYLMLRKNAYYANSDRSYIDIEGDHGLLSLAEQIKSDPDFSDELKKRLCEEIQKFIRKED